MSNTRNTRRACLQMANARPLLKVLSLWQSFSEVSLVQPMFKWPGFKLGLWKCHILFSIFKYANSWKSSWKRNHQSNIYCGHSVSECLQRWFLVSLWKWLSVALSNMITWLLFLGRVTDALPNHFNTPFNTLKFGCTFIIQTGSPGLLRPTFWLLRLSPNEILSVN